MSRPDSALSARHDRDGHDRARHDRADDRDRRAARADDDDERGASGSGRRWLAAGTCVGLIALGVLVYFAIGWISAEPEPREPGPRGPLVEVAPVRSVDTLTVAQTGFVRPAARLILSAEVSGRVARVADDFRVGRRIGEGEVLVELDRARFEAEVAAAEARLAGARSSRDLAASNVTRQQRLEDGGFAADQRLEEVSTALAAAEADASLAASQLELARIALDDTTIRAPYAALVSARDVSLGQIVRPGTNVGELVMATRAEVQVGLLPRQRALLGSDATLVGRPVDLYAIDGLRRAIATGRIAAVDPVLDPVSRTLGIVVDVSDPFENGALKVGELVEAVVPVPSADTRVFEVPARALKGADRLWVVRDGSLRAVDPEIVRREGARVQVTSDALEVDDRVLVTDIAAAVEGLAVRVADDDGSGDVDGDAEGGADDDGKRRADGAAKS